MPIYLKPLRRKIGLVTLVMACVLMAGWIRSLTYYDDATFIRSTDLSESLISYRGSLNWMRTDSDRSVLLLMSNDKRFFWTSSPITEKSLLMVDLPKAVWQAIGMSIRTYLGSQGQITMFVVSYWSIVTPLTLVSAYLLLCKPKQSRPCD